MAIEMGLVPEPHGALGTLERLLAGVRSHVLLQIFIRREFARALGTRERLLAGVRSHVLLQVAFEGEALLAEVAPERPRAGMHQQMTAQVHFGDEALGTEVACERPLARVAPVVDFQVVFVPERLGTNGTHERFLFFMNDGDVTLQNIFVRETTLALVTLKGTFAGVEVAHVSCVVRRFKEFTRTLLA